MQVKCPECETLVDVPDDPTRQQMIDALNAQQKSLERFAEMLADLGKKVTVPVVDVPGVEATRKRGKVVYEGVFVDFEEDEADDAEEKE